MNRIILALSATLLSTAGLSACSSTPSTTSVDSGAPVDAGGEDVSETGTDTDTGCVDPDGDGFGPGCEGGEDDCLPGDATSYPGAAEFCGDFVDNDCDGDVDEDCPCVEARVEVCYTGPLGSVDVGICAAGFRTCSDGEWTECGGQVVPRSDVESQCDGVDENCDGNVDEELTNACGLCGAPPLEICGDGLDNDCNGVIDDLDAGCDCAGRTRQPCYSASPRTLGVGRCRGGLTDCGDDGAWGACIGELLPIDEVCDGLDNDCDGFADEGLRNRCGVCGAPEPPEVCDGVDNDCDGGVDEGLRLACGLCPGALPEETCGDSLDNDCDGRVDEECPCTGSSECFPGPAEAMGVGECASGSRVCDATGEFWGSCTGFFLPSIEVCDGLDNDCDGATDVGPDGCSVCGVEPEICDDVDNDCDGLTDEGVRNTCGVCLTDVVPEEVCDGEDEDCDGFTDEGLTNACGTCDESCYRAEWSDPAGWAQGEFDGVDDTDTEGGLRLGTTRASFPDLWVANTDDNTVTRIDTDEAAATGTFPVGLDPSRTAVDFDGNVFVANRAFGEQGSLTRVLARGCEGDDCVQWTVDIGGIGSIPRGLAVDREGFAWVGTYAERQLFRVSPVDGEIVGTWDLPVSVYGLAIDSEGIIWISTISASGIGAFDSNTNRYLGSWSVPECGTPYGIAVDGDGNVWAGAWRCDGLIRLDRRAFEEGDIDLRRFSHPNMVETRGVAVDGDGMIYLAASGTDRLGKFDPATEDWAWTVPTCENPIGVGIGSDGNIWVMCRGSAEAVRFSPDGDELNVVPTGRGPYSYSDMTGFQLRNFTAPSGTWNVIFDCGFPGCAFDRIRYDAAQPDGTRVQVRARTRAAEPADAAWSDWTPAFDISPAEIGPLVGDGRFIEVEVSLSTTDRAVTPVVTSVEVEWQRP